MYHRPRKSGVRLPTVNKPPKEKKPPKPAEEASAPGAPVPLPLEVWQQVALRMSSRDMAKGLVQTCKQLRNLSTSAICLSSSTQAALEWAQKRWACASKLRLQPSKAPDCSPLMSWVALQCTQLGPLDQLNIITNAATTENLYSSPSVAAMVALLSHQAGNLRVLHLDMWEIPQLPHMRSLKHLMVAVSTAKTSDFMWTCLMHLTELETLDLKLISGEGQIEMRKVDLGNLTKLQRLRLCNVAPSALVVRPECKIAVQQWANMALNAPMCKSGDLDVHTVLWTLRTALQNKWPDFITNWGGLQKLDLSVVSLGSAARVSLDAIARIPIVRIKSQQGMNITVPKKALWKHLWLECSLTMDITFEDVNTFGMGLIELWLIFGGFHGGKIGSDVLLSLNLINQGLRRVTDNYDVKTRRKTLCARKRNTHSVAQTVHDSCICGACAVCLMKAGSMHDHAPGNEPAIADLSPLLHRSRASAYQYQAHHGVYEEDHVSDSECECYECLAQREEEEEYSYGY